jgi:hypothetical protein
MSNTGFPFLNNLKDYQKRENRQSWSSWYQRMRSPLGELLDDPEVIAEAEFVSYTGNSKQECLYKYHDGEIKLRAESRVNIYPFQEGFYEHVTAIRGAKLRLVKPAEKVILVNIPQKDPPQKICIMPQAPLNSRAINDSIATYTASPESFPCVTRILQREPSLISPQEKVLLKHHDKKVDAIIDKAVNLDQSHFTVQGPPGTGKTYVGARIILELILQGRRVGVMALSHKAINNLLQSVDELLDFYKVTGANCIKTRSPENSIDGFNNIRLGDLASNVHQAHLLAGTVYSLSRLPNRVIDTLVIDEAGQIPLAWIMAAGRTAKNIVMLGDHKQLPQVSQSMHPEGSGESVLEHLMGEDSIIKEHFGNFLSITRRMNPEITAFVSHLMYNGKLKPHLTTSKAILRLPKAKHPALNKKGLSWIEMQHQGCSQESPDEAREILSIINELKEQDYPLSEVLVIAPYRAQEALIRNLLPKTMKDQIGTVDRFQGREADIVIFSMTSSDGHNLPRDIDFLFSVNRLNVALSRARKKAIILANNRLLTIPVNNLEQLKLVNALCRLKHVCQKD